MQKKNTHDDLTSNIPNDSRNRNPKSVRYKKFL